MTDWPSPPYSIRTPRCVVRCYEPRDVDGLHAAVGRNVEALRPWMPWIADEPLNREARAQLVRRFRGEFDLGRNFIYGVFDHEGAFVGGTGLHPRGGHSTLEIGYWLVRSRWGDGLTTEVAAGLTQVALRWMGASRVEIRAATANVGSRRIPEKLGFTQEGVLRGIGAPAGNEHAQDLVVYAMMAEDLDGSAADGVRIQERGFSPDPRAS